MLLSLWLNKQFTKGEILRLYIASVRYEKGVLGLSNAIKYFFGDLKNKELTNEEAFFLVERLSNITFTVKRDRIEHLVLRTDIEIDKEKLKLIYDEQIDSGRLKNSYAQHQIKKIEVITQILYIASAFVLVYNDTLRKPQLFISEGR